MTEQKATSVFPSKEIEHVQTDQLTAPTWLLLLILIVSLLVLKGFIYIKDDKRHGK